MGNPLGYLAIGFALISAAYAFYMFKYWEFRTVYPIRYRWPKLTLFKMTFLWLLHLFFLLQSILINELPCSFTLIFAMFLIPGIIATVMVQMTVIYFASAMVKDAEQFKSLKYLTQRQSEVKFTSTAWFIKYRRYFTRASLLTTMGVIDLIFTIPFLVVAGTRSPTFWSQTPPACTPGFPAFQFVVFTELGIFALIFTFLLRTILKVDENIGLKQEFRALLIIPVFYIAAPLVGSISDSLVVNVIAVTMVSYWPLLLSLLSTLAYPVFEARKNGFIKQAIQSDKQGKMAAELLDVNGKCIHPNVKDLLLLLSIPDGFDLFTEFAKKEFSVENLLFYAAVREYKKTYAQGVTKGPSGEVLIRQRFETIYENFIHNDGQFCININSITREDIAKYADTGLLGPQQDMKSDIQASSFTVSSLPPKEVFDPALNMIINLLAQDTFKRFKLTDEYGKFKEVLNKTSNMNELTEVLGMGWKANDDAQEFSVSKGDLREPSLVQGVKKSMVGTSQGY
jgi:hypothetical protein